MRNKFFAFFILIVFPLILFDSSCKKSEAAGVYVITSGQGSIFYDGIAVSFDLSFRCTILNQSDVPGTITA
jgi:hypothetical protein